MSASQNEKYQKVISQERVVSTKFIKLASFVETQEKGWLRLNIPSKNCIANVKAKYISTDKSGGFYWYGEVIKDDINSERDCECSSGYINILQSEGEIIGTISLDDDNFEIQSLGEGREILAEKKRLVARCGTNNQNTPGSIDPDLISDSEIGNRENCPVKVLALFTPAANIAVNNITSTINLSIAETKQALRNSGVPESDLELILVDIQQIQFVESANIGADRDVLIADPTIQALRDEANADIVVVYTDGNFQNNGQNIIGVAGTLNLEPERALCLIEADFASSDFNTAHEIGHLFSCRHELSIDSTGQFEHPRDFRCGTWPFRVWRNTIMLSQTTGRTIQNFSNPNIEHRGTPTGRFNLEENFRQFKGTACIVADFRDDNEVPLLNTTISGDSYGCPCHGIALLALTSGGTPGPYQLAWRISQDGFNWSSVQGTTSSFSITLPCEIGEGVYVRLTATSLDGQVDDSFKFIEAADGWPGQEGVCQRSSFINEDISDSDNSLNLLSGNIFPNPVNEVLNLQLGENDVMPSDISVIDVNGRFVVVNPEFDINQRTVQIPTEHLPEGMYFLQYGKRNICKFIKASN